MVKPLLTLKPSVLNALVPMLVRNLFYSILAGIILFWIYFGLGSTQIINYSTKNSLIGGIVLFVSIVIIPVLVQLIKLYNSNYYFYRSHVVSEFKFFRKHRHSVPYNQISNIRVNISLWDRLSNAGDLVLHTAESQTADLTLNYIKDPLKIENAIYRLMGQKPAVKSG